MCLQCDCVLIPTEQESKVLEVWSTLIKTLLKKNKKSCKGLIIRIRKNAKDGYHQARTNKMIKKCENRGPKVTEVYTGSENVSVVH